MDAATAQRLQASPEAISYRPVFWPSNHDSGLDEDLRSAREAETTHARPRRQRLSSLPMGRSVDGLSELVRRSMHFRAPSNFDVFTQPSETVDATQGESSADDNASKNPVSKLLRRASTSIKRRTRRASHSQALNAFDSARHDRPTTSSSTWHKLKSATSFNRNSGYEPSWVYTNQNGGGPLENIRSNSQSPELTRQTSVGYVDAYIAPIPGAGNAPPIIPRGVGGAAARATAAAQNELLERTKVNHVPHGHGRESLINTKHDLIDRESAVELSLPEEQDVIATMDSTKFGEGGHIAKLDFLSLLPAELSLRVLRDLDHRALAQASLVNKQWHRLCNESSIWRDAFYRDKTVAAAIGHPIVPGSGLGIPAPTAEKDFKKLYQAKNDLDRNWREGDARAVYLNGHTDSVYCVQFDEHKVITGSRDKTIRIWDMHTYACKLIIAPPHVANLPNLIKSDKDGSLLHHATIHNDSETPTDVSFSKPRVESFAIFHDASILCLQYDQDILVTGSSDGTCIIYDIAQGYRPIRQLTHHTAAVLDLSFDDKHIVTCSKDATICIWNRQTGKLMRQLTGHGGPVNAVQLRGNLIVSCSGDFSVKLWNLDTGKNIREFSGHTKGLACSVLSADSRYIASAGNDRVIRVWDAMSGECLQKIEAHTNLVRSLHIDSVSGRLISGSYDQDIKVFDLLTGQLLLDFPQWHSSWVLGAKSDYRRIVSTGQDRKILIMDFGGDVKGVDELMSAPQETSLARQQRLQHLKEKAAIEAAEDEARQQVQGWTLLGGTERP